MACYTGSIATHHFLSRFKTCLNSFEISQEENGKHVIKYVFPCYFLPLINYNYFSMELEPPLQFLKQRQNKNHIVYNVLSKKSQSRFSLAFPLAHGFVFKITCSYSGNSLELTNVITKLRKNIWLEGIELWKE